MVFVKSTICPDQNTKMFYVTLLDDTIEPDLYETFVQYIPGAKFANRCENRIM